MQYSGARSLPFSLIFGLRTVWYSEMGIRNSDREHDDCKHTS